MRSIARHIMALVINSLGHGHTHTNTHTNDLHSINFKKPGVSVWPAHARFKNVQSCTCHTCVIIKFQLSCTVHSQHLLLISQLHTVTGQWCSLMLEHIFLMLDLMMLNLMLEHIFSQHTMPGYKYSYYRHASSCMCLYVAVALNQAMRQRFSRTSSDVALNFLRHGSYFKTRPSFAARCGW